MFHSSVVSGNSVFRKLRGPVGAALVLLVTGLLVLPAADVAASPSNVISGVTVSSTGNMNTLRIRTSSEPAYTVYELFNPSRIVVDIADAAAADENVFNLAPSLPVSLAATSVTDTDPALTRLEFSFGGEYATYDVRTENNDIVLSVTMNDGSGGAVPMPTAMPEKQDIESQLPAPALTASQASAGAPASASATQSLERSFSFGGYNKTRITVDFYKIDLHNVFRLFREVSGINIVVDEAVSGSLTLALNDVPWDFALDIILNLKDLQKEERFNTIVILPKSKEFSWPERAEDNLAFQADENVAVQEAIVIQQQQNLSPELVEAKKKIQAGRNAEKKGFFEDAIKAYSEAFTLWPDNERLANKIASIYLVYLRQNARAVHFAKQALAINGNNAAAALNAAIALANMHEYDEARQYFDQSVNVAKPSREALLSYAVFSEERGSYEAAIKLLERFESLYGANLDSMVATARLLDKQGDQQAATEKYKSVLLSGFQIPPDLRKYINSRIALNQ